MNDTTVIVEPGTNEVRAVRVFEAPRELVFATMMDPREIPNWWGPARLTTTVDRMEPHAGGSWRYEQRDRDGSVHGFHGVYHDVQASERVVMTFEYEGAPGHVLMTTAHFEDLGGGRTRLTQSSVYQSVTDRDAMVATGMESGLREGMDRIAALVERARTALG